MTKRRGRAEGSIYRRKDGSWVAQYTAGDKRRYIYGKTRKDVAARLSKAIAEKGLPRNGRRNAWETIFR